MTPPAKSKNLLTDIWLYLLKKPAIPTLIRFRNPAQRQNYNQRILQRLGIQSDDFAILNIHQIGINAPVSHVYNQLLQWNGDTTTWPNNLARVERLDNDLGNIRILLLGIDENKGFRGRLLNVIKLMPLFKLTEMQFKQTPDAYDFDNARYLLYHCSGGYPIGFFGLYVRSPIADLGEKLPAQLFSLTTFNFYGKKYFDRTSLVYRFWAAIHNRVSANVLNRMKQMAEWHLEQLSSTSEKSWNDI